MKFRDIIIKEMVYQTISDISLLNSNVNGFTFSSDLNTFLNENLKSFFTECNFTEIPFNEVDHPVYIDCKYYDINDFNPFKQQSMLTFLCY